SLNVRRSARCFERGGYLRDSLALVPGGDQLVLRGWFVGLPGAGACAVRGCGSEEDRIAVACWNDDQAEMRHRSKQGEQRRLLAAVQGRRRDEGAADLSV